MLHSAALRLLVVTLLGVAVVSGPASASTTSEVTTRPSLVLVMDASGSMAADAGGGVTRIEAARRAVVELADALPDAVDVGLVLYGHRQPNTVSAAVGCDDVELVAPVAPLDRDALAAAVEDYDASGYTPIADALEVALDALPDSGPRQVVLVSDGIDTCAPPDPCEVASAAAAREVELTVEVIGLQVDEADAEAQLRCIAEATGGVYTPVDDAADLASRMTRLSLRGVRPYQVQGPRIEGAADAIPGNGFGGMDESAPAPAVSEGVEVFWDLLTLGESRSWELAVPPGRDVAAAVTIVPTSIPADLGEQPLGMALARFRGCGGNDLDTDGVVRTVEATTEPCRDVDGSAVLDIGVSGDDGATEFRAEVRVFTLDTVGPRRVPVAGDGAVAGGPTPALAPALPTGPFDVEVRTSERQFWSVDLAAGQQLEVTQDLSRDETVGRKVVAVDVGVMGPFGATDPLHRNERLLVDGSTDEASTLLFPSDGPAEVPGTWTFFVTVNPPVPGQRPHAVTGTVTAAVVGEALPDPEPLPDPTPSPEPTPEDEPSRAPTTTEDPSTLADTDDESEQPDGGGGTVAVLVAVALLAVAAASAVVVRRRRG